MDQDGSGVGGEGGTEMVHATEVEVGRWSDVVDVGLKGQCAIEDDTQTLDLRGGGNRELCRQLEGGCEFWIVWIWYKQEELQFCCC